MCQTHECFHIIINAQLTTSTGISQVEVGVAKEQISRIGKAYINNAYQLPCKVGQVGQGNGLWLNRVISHTQIHQVGDV